MKTHRIERYGERERGEECDRGSERQIFELVAISVDIKKFERNVSIYLHAKYSKYINAHFLNAYNKHKVRLQKQVKESQVHKISVQ